MMFFGQISFSGLLGQYAQNEYAVAYALTIGLILLGLLAITVPRPRRGVTDDPKTKKRKKKKKKRGKKR